jgi:hypothetical protein
MDYGVLRGRQISSQLAPVLKFQWFASHCPLKTKAKVGSIGKENPLHRYYIGVTWGIKHVYFNGVSNISSIILYPIGSCPVFL